MFVAYLDLLGTKEMALTDSAQYKEFTDKLKKHLIGLSKDLVGLKINVFSDSVYIEASDENVIAKFINELRLGLLLEQVFFTAAICDGVLGIENISSNCVSGILLNDPTTIKVFLNQSQLKGIGILVEGKLSQREDLVVKSLYPVKTKDNLEGYEKFNDIKFNISFENTLQLMKFTIEKYLKLSLLSKGAAKYYFTLFYSLLYSWGNLSEEQINEIIQMLDDYDANCISEDLLINYYASFLNYFLSRSKPEDYNLENIMLPFEKIYFFTKCVKAISNISDAIISKTNKALIIDYYYLLCTKKKNI